MNSAALLSDPRIDQKLFKRCWRLVLLVQRKVGYLISFNLEDGYLVVGNRVATQTAARLKEGDLSDCCVFDIQLVRLLTWTLLLHGSSSILSISVLFT